MKLPRELVTTGGIRLKSSDHVDLDPLLIIRRIFERLCIEHFCDCHWLRPGLADHLDEGKETGRWALQGQANLGNPPALPLLLILQGLNQPVGGM